MASQKTVARIENQPVKVKRSDDLIERALRTVLETARAAEAHSKAVKYLKTVSTGKFINIKGLGQIVSQPGSKDKGVDPEHADKHSCAAESRIEADKALLATYPQARTEFYTLKFVDLRSDKERDEDEG